MTDSEEDDVLYEKLSGEQWRLECLMHLLAELRDSDLPGAWFLDLLQARRPHTHTLQKLSLTPQQQEQGKPLQQAETLSRTRLGWETPLLLDP